MTTDSVQASKARFSHLAELILGLLPLHPCAQCVSSSIATRFIYRQDEERTRLQPGAVLQDL